MGLVSIIINPNTHRKVAKSAKVEFKTLCVQRALALQIIGEG